jgi:hypothetical protein
MIPVGSDGEPCLDLMIKKKQIYRPLENDARRESDIPYHQ